MSKQMDHYAVHGAHGMFTTSAGMALVTVRETFDADLMTAAAQHIRAIPEGTVLVLHDVLDNLYGRFIRAEFDGRLYNLEPRDLWPAELKVRVRELNEIFNERLKGLGSYASMKRTPDDLLLERLWSDRRKARVKLRLIMHANRRLAAAVEENAEMAFTWHRACADRLKALERERERGMKWRERALAAERQAKEWERRAREAGYDPWGGGVPGCSADM